MKIMLLTISLLALMLFIPGVLALVQNYNAPMTDSNYANFQIVTLRYDPFPVQAGQYFDLWLKVENSGDSPAEGFTFTLNPEYPFSLDNNEVATRSFGTIGARQSVLLKYKVRVDEGAAYGPNRLSYTYTLRKGGRKIGGFVEVTVGIASTVLDVTNSYIDNVTPGEEADFKFNLKNVASSFVKDVVVSLDLTGIPVGAYNDVSERRFSIIRASESMPVVFKLRTNPDAAPGIYEIPLLLRYSDNLGNDYVQNMTTSMAINDKIELLATVDKTDVYQSGDGGTITIAITNKGVGTAQFVEVIADENKGYKIFGERKIYFGSIDSDDDQTGKLSIIVDEDEGKIISIPLRIFYENSFNKQKELDTKIELPLYTASELKSMGLKSDYTLFILAGAAIIILALVLAYLRWESRR